MMTTIRWHFAAAILLANTAHAADSLLTWDDLRAFKVSHAYSASDGRSYVEEISVPSSEKPSGGKPAYLYFDLKPQTIRIGRSTSGPLMDWHYAGDYKHLIITLQGELVFDTGDGELYGVKPGEAILAEDWTGKGHKSGCMTNLQPTCVGIDILFEPNPRSIPLREPPAQRANKLKNTLASGSRKTAANNGGADSLLAWDNYETLKIYHAYSASDGRSYIETIYLPAKHPASGMTGWMYLDLHPQAVRIARAATGSMIDWHYAGESRHLIISMQGDTVFDLGDGKLFHVKAGEAILAEDWTGKGHRSGCEATDGRSCVVIDILVDPNPRALPLRAPPGQ